MPTRNVSITPEQNAFLEEMVRSGEYQNASEAVRDALRALRQRRREDALKLEALRLQIEAGVDALEDGAFTEIADDDLDTYLEGLTAASDKPARQSPNLPFESPSPGSHLADARLDPPSPRRRGEGKRARVSGRAG